MRRRGVTLLELLLTLGIVVLILGSVSHALAIGLNYQSKVTADRDVLNERAEFEEKVRDLISHAYLSPDATDANSYFVLGASSSQPLSSGTSSSTTSPTSSTNDLTFTVTGLRISSAVLDSTDDFETNNKRFGPVGGVTEIALETTAVGEQGQGRSGLFLRKQTPSDSDSTQGGYERVLNANLSEISYEFFDGTEWLTTWDTSTMTTKRLPASVRVTYRLTNDETDHVFYVTLLNSDVTINNPVTTTVSQ